MDCEYADKKDVRKDDLIQGVKVQDKLFNQGSDLQSVQLYILQHTLHYSIA